MRSWNLGLVAWLALSASVSLLSQKPQGVGADGPWRIPVLVVNYLPRTADGLRIDIAVTSNVDAPVTEIEEKCRRQTAETIEALEQGSRFRAYKNPEAKPSLDYEVVHTETFYEAMPHDAKHPGYADYNAMLARIDVATWVEKKGVREIWFWGYHSKQIAPNESNMAGPHGDVSNSYRHEDDLPRLSKTYTVYHYNYERDTAMAVHNHLHQIEALMRAHGGELWQLFEGKAGAWRCGNCHFPPNARFDYDWRNKAPVDSDIADWRPEGLGKKERINCDLWGGDDLRWYVYWMQSIPGAANGLEYRGHKLSNWWQIVGDYDATFDRKDKLLGKR